MSLRDHGGHVTGKTSQVSPAPGQWSPSRDGVVSVRGTRVGTYGTGTFPWDHGMPACRAIMG